MSTTDIQREARALGDPTRYRIFRYIVEADHPVNVAELTDYVRLNHNAVRQHLAVLGDANLVTEEAELRQSAGRPRLLYRLSSEAAGKWTTSGPYEWLAGRLSAALRTRKSPREIGRRAGVERGRNAQPFDDPTEAIERDLERSGFHPLRRERGQRVDFVLGRCPFEAVAVESPDIVCQLHLGLAEGLADGLGGLEIERLTTKDPRRAGCRLVVQRVEVALKSRPSRSRVGR
jgi:predicted ArsR family transcriptional regulator